MICSGQLPRWVVVASWLLGCGSRQQHDESSDTATPDASDLKPIPDIPFAPASADSFELNPELGIVTSRRDLLVTLREDITAEQFGDVVATSGAELAGSLADVFIIQLRYPKDVTWEALEASLNELAGHPAVEGVTEDMQLFPTMVPREPEGGQVGVNIPYRWGRPADGNWGLELINAPQAWNVRWHAFVRSPAPAPISVGIIDMALQRHPDLAAVTSSVCFSDTDGNDVRDTWVPDCFTDSSSNRFLGGDPLWHGAAVASIMGATWNNRQYIDGIASIPYVDKVDLASAEETGQAVALQGWSIRDLWLSEIHNTTTMATLFDMLVRQVAEHVPRPRIINLSMGYDWSGASYPWPVEASNLAARLRVSGQQFASLVRQINRTGEILFVVAAGNESSRRLFPAQYGSPMNDAAYWEPDMRDHIIIVEALERVGTGQWSAQRSPYSNVDSGGVFAPGTEVAVLAGGETTATVLFESGTSFAAPFVAGAAAFLLALKPTLTNAELRHLLTEAPCAKPQEGGSSTTFTRLDLLSAVRCLEDDVRSTLPITQWLCDMDDGTADGFQRAILADDNTVQKIDETDSHGDDRCDLSDFRRMRDTFLLMSGYALDCTLDNPKCDLNEDGVARLPAEEVFPRAAIDGDNEVVSESDVAILAEEYAVDEDSLQQWPVEALPGLLYSADLRIRAAARITALGASAIRLTIEGDAPAGVVVPEDRSPLEDIEITAAEPEVVLTTPLIQNALIRWHPVTDMGAGDEEGDEHVLEIGDLQPGEDRVITFSPLPACDFSPYTIYEGWQHTCVVSVTGIPSRIEPGQTMTLTFQAVFNESCEYSLYGEAHPYLWVTYATPNGPLDSGLTLAAPAVNPALDLAPTTECSIEPYSFEGTEPFYVISINDNLSHTVSFTVDSTVTWPFCISEGEPGCVTLISGPAVVVQGAWWRDVRMFQIGGP